MNMFPIQPYRISDQHQNIKNWQRQLNLADPEFTFDVQVHIQYVVRSNNQY